MVLPEFDILKELHLDVFQSFLSKAEDQNAFHRTQKQLAQIKSQLPPNQANNINVAPLPAESKPSLYQVIINSGEDGNGASAISAFQNALLKAGKELDALPAGRLLGIDSQKLYTQEQAALAK